MQTCPSVELPPATPFTFQSTPVLAEFRTCAVNVSRLLTLSVVAAGASATVRAAAAVIASAIEAAFQGAATGVAVTLTSAGDGPVVGAV
jgi:hypothetical protein